MTKAIYQLNNVIMNYGDKCVLNIPDLTIKQGQCIALTGENGAGKSTLLTLLAGLKQASSGQISLNNQTMTLPLKTAQRQRIGWVNQHPYLLAGSVESNLQLALKLQSIPRSQHQQLIEHALEQTNSTHLINQATNTLSGGELKRVAIARAIVYQPDIILLDEPFSHLDSQHSQLLAQCIQTLALDNKTILFSTHNQQHDINLADNTITLVNGELA